LSGRSITGWRGSGNPTTAADASGAWG
jgi:hypothetical protein